MISQLKVCDFISTSTSNLPGLLGAAGGRPRRRDTRSGAVRLYPHAAALVPAPRVLYGALTVRRADDSRRKCARSLHNLNTHSRPPTLNACIPPFTVCAPHSSPLTACASFPFHARSSRAVLDEEFFIRAKLPPNARRWKHASLATFLTFVKQRFTLKKSPTGAFV